MIRRIRSFTSNDEKNPSRRSRDSRNGQYWGILNYIYNSSAISELCCAKYTFINICIFNYQAHMVHVKHPVFKRGEIPALSVLHRDPLIQKGSILYETSLIQHRNPLFQSREGVLKDMKDPCYISERSLLYQGFITSISGKFLTGLIPSISVGPGAALIYQGFFLFFLTV